MTEQIEVYPDKSGEWRWHRKAANGKITADSGEGYSVYGGALEAARKEAGSVPEPVFDAKGDPLGTVRAEGCRIVMLRKDGSLYGEVDPAPTGGGAAQRVSLTPANETNEGGKL